MSDIVGYAQLDGHVHKVSAGGQKNLSSELQEITGPQVVARPSAHLPLIAQVGDSNSSSQISAGETAVAKVPIAPESAEESLKRKQLLRQCDPCLGALTGILVRLSDQHNTPKFWQTPKIACEFASEDDLMNYIPQITQGDFYAKENRLVEVANLDCLTPHADSSRSFEYIIGEARPTLSEMIAQLKGSYESVDFAGIAARLPADSQAKSVAENFRVSTAQFLKEVTKLAIIVCADTDAEGYFGPKHGRENRQLKHMQNAYFAVRDAGFALWREETRD